MNSEPFIIKNGLIVTVNENDDIFSGDIYISENRITDVAPEIARSESNLFDASDYIVIPGFVQTHTRSFVYSRLQRMACARAEAASASLPRTR